MTLMEQVQALLNPLATNGAHVMIAPQGTQAPFIIWQRVISQTENVLLGATNVQNTRMQIDCYASKYSDVITLKTTVENAMAGAAFQNVQLTEQDFYEADVKLFRVSFDYSIWSTN